VGPTQSTAVSHKSCLSHAGAGTGTACLTNACLASSHAAPCSSSPPIHSTTPAAALALSHSAFSLRATPPRSLPLAPISPSAAAPATSSRLRRLSPTVSLRCRLRSYIFFSPRSTVLPPLLPFSRATARRRSMPPPFLPLLFSPAPSLTPPAPSQHPLPRPPRSPCPASPLFVSLFFLLPHGATVNSLGRRPRSCTLPSYRFLISLPWSSICRNQSIHFHLPRRFKSQSITLAFPFIFNFVDM
jgi:hypothetical protein